MLRRFHNLGERYRIEASPANQRTVDFRLFHQALDIIRLHAAAVQNTDAARCFFAETLLGF